MSDSVVENPLFGAVIGRQIGNNAHAEADRIRAEAEVTSANSAADAGALVAAILRKQVDELSQSDFDFRCSIAGVRGVTRELLEELRKADPENPMLDKKVRDKVFYSAKQEQEKRVSGMDFRERDELTQKHRDDAFGSEGSNAGGPEKSKITPNLAVRAEAGVPSHVSDREKFLGLIERLAAELRAANPRAAILSDKEMVDVFETNI